MRRNRRWSMAAAVALVAAGLLLWRCTHDTSDEGFITELRVLDDDTAIVVWRANYQDRDSRGWIGRIDVRGRTRWVRELPSAPMSQASVVVAGGVVTLRYSRDGNDHSMIGYGLDDGRKRWDVELTRVAGDNDSPSSAWLPPYLSSLAVGEQILTWAYDGSETQLFAVDAATGEIAWRRSGAHDARSPLLVGDRAIVHAAVGEVAFLDGSDVPPTAFTAAGIGCVVDGDFYTVIDAGEGYDLVAYAGGDPARRRVVASPFEPVGHGYQHLISCGSYGDQLVFSIDVSLFRNATNQTRSLVVVTNRAGVTRRMIELPHDMRWHGSEDVLNSYPTAAPLSGQLTRFVPYLQVGYGDDAANRLIVLDLDQGTIAWHGPQDDSTIHMNLFRGDTHWFLVANMPWPVVISIDGTTGRLTAAIRADSDERIGDLLPIHAANDRIWLHSWTWNTFDRPPIAVLDAATLEPTFARDVAITDVTAEVREALGYGRSSTP